MNEREKRQKDRCCRCHRCTGARRRHHVVECAFPLRHCNSVNSPRYLFASADLHGLIRYVALRTRAQRQAARMK